MVIAAGSYPAGRWFESDRRYHYKQFLRATERKLNIYNLIRPLGQAVKTSPFHGGIMGSNPVGVTNEKQSFKTVFSFFGLFFKFSDIDNYIIVCYNQYIADKNPNRTRFSGVSHA